MDLSSIIFEICKSFFVGRGGGIVASIFGVLWYTGRRNSGMEESMMTFSEIKYERVDMEALKAELSEIGRASCRERV